MRYNPTLRAFCYLNRPKWVTAASSLDWLIWVMKRYSFEVGSWSSNRNLAPYLLNIGPIYVWRGLILALKVVIASTVEKATHATNNGWIDLDGYIYGQDARSKAGTDVYQRKQTIHTTKKVVCVCLQHKRVSVSMSCMCSMHYMQRAAN